MNASSAHHAWGDQTHLLAFEGASARASTGVPHGLDPYGVDATVITSTHSRKKDHHV